MTKHRQRVEILYDVLNICNSGALLSNVCQTGNMSHYFALNCINKLINTNLLMSYKTKHKIIYHITPKGINILPTLKEIMEITK